MAQPWVFALGVVQALGIPVIFTTPPCDSFSLELKKIKTAIS
jgi:hypothetical protein